MPPELFARTAGFRVKKFFMKTTLNTLPYLDYERQLPQSGQVILAQERNDNLIVYQAFHPETAKYAVDNQRFGGSRYSFARMSWIKPNFLWMMYRAGWASKEGQERILAIELPKPDFIAMLQKAVYSSYQPQLYGSQENWKAALETSDVRLQWDPDHNPSGQKLERRAIQIGLRGETLRAFATKQIVSIEDITDFVREQAAHVEAGHLHELWVPAEQAIHVEDAGLRAFLGI